jgi:hypothetical protein
MLVSRRLSLSSKQKKSNLDSFRMVSFSVDFNISSDKFCSLCYVLLARMVRKSCLITDCHRHHMKWESFPHFLFRLIGKAYIFVLLWECCGIYHIRIIDLWLLIRNRVNDLLWLVCLISVRYFSNWYSFMKVE